MKLQCTHQYFRVLQSLVCQDVPQGELLQGPMHRPLQALPSACSNQKATKEKEIPIEGLEFMGHGKEKPEISS